MKTNKETIKNSLKQEKNSYSQNGFILMIIYSYGYHYILGNLLKMIY